MTLFIAYLLLYNFGYSGGWYAFAGLLWVLHLMAHGSNCEAEKACKATPCRASLLGRRAT